MHLTFRNIPYHWPLIIRFGPPRKHLCSASGACAIKRRKQRWKYKEELVKRPIYNGCPVKPDGPPVEIYDETIAKLKRDLRNLSKVPEPSADYISQTANLFHASVPIFDSEPLRTMAVYGLLDDSWLPTFDFLSRHLRKNPIGRARRWMLLSVKFLRTSITKRRPLLWLTWNEKNEFGLRGEAGLQAALSLRKYVCQ